MPGVRYGFKETEEHDPETGVTRRTKEHYANFEPTDNRTITYFDIKRVKDENEALAVFLKLLDMQKAGKYFNVGMQCKRNDQNGSLRIECQWQVINL